MESRSEVDDKKLEIEIVVKPIFGLPPSACDCIYGPPTALNQLFWADMSGYARSTASVGLNIE